jgi:hypothetical protein
MISYFDSRSSKVSGKNEIKFFSVVFIGQGLEASWPQPILLPELRSK